MKVPKYVIEAMKQSTRHKKAAAYHQDKVMEWLLKKRIDLDSNDFHEEFGFWNNATDGYDYIFLLEAIQKL